MKKIGKKTGTLVLWASAYVNLIVFALCGGYVWLKSDDEYLKNETKKALIVSLVFVAIGAIQTLFGQCYTLFGVSYSSDIYRLHQIVGYVISVAKVIVCAVFALLGFLGADSSAEEKTQTNEKKNNDESESSEKED